MSLEIGQESLLRAGVFVLALALLALFERLAPKRDYAANRWLRWRANFSLLILDTLLLRLCFPLAAVGIAWYADQHLTGLFHRFQLPGPLAWSAGLLVLDCVIYWQHRLLHRIPLLWRLHKIHHTDLDLDCSTGVRFHPLEILFSMLLKAAVILALGIPAGAVLIFEILLNTGSLYTHSNITLPAAIEARLRRLFVTPDMHRIHHSVNPAETDSNFSFNLNLWDRLFGSYCAAPSQDPRSMALGLSEYRDARELGLFRLLKIPFI
ncbi:MAG TPA: sterol desaturase family protein [Gammaproteobacteria bacterium]|nr:sterol desaturase family protein [Gammaproteobacteria bacterium]